MPISKQEQEFVSYVIELMQPLGSVRAKRMFGGHGIFLDSLMFALIADSVLYLKTDKETVVDFEQKDLQAFSYAKNGKEFKMAYYQAPEEALENIEEMNVWANKAYAVALRTAFKKRNK